MPGRDVDPRFGERMRELMRQRGTSYRALALRTLSSSSALHRIAQATMSAEPDLATLIDRALDAGGQLAALAHPVPVDVPAPSGDTGEVLRRDLLGALLGLGLGERSSIAAFITSLAAGDRAGDVAVDEWNQIVWEYGYTYNSTTARETLLSELSADLATITAQTSHAIGRPTVAGLHGAAAHLAGLVAMVCIDMGYRREARHAWLLGRRLAHSSGDPVTRVWVLGEEALLGLYCGRPLQVVLDLAEHGLATAGTADAAGVAHLRGARAQALALLDRPDAAVEELRALEGTFARLPASVTGRSGTVFAWTEDRLRHTESYVHSVLGRTGPAFAAQDRALAVYGETKAIGRAQIQMHRAACLVRDGDVRGGIGHASSTLDSVPAHARGNYVLTVAETVADSVPIGHRDDSAVLDYRHQIAAIRNGVSAKWPTR